MLAEFESGRSQPAAAVVTKRSGAQPEPPAEAKKARSKFARDRAAGRSEQKAEEEEQLEPPVDMIDNLVLRGIVERDVEGLVALPPEGRHQQAPDFPPILKITTAKPGDEGGGGKPSKRSIFAQQFMKMKNSLSGMVVDELGRQTRSASECISG
jgi:hypothetical protein